MADEAIKALRRAVVKGKGDKFSDGDVIRWESYSTAKNFAYTYAALRAGGRWWITGVASWYGKTVFTYKELVDDVLSREDVKNISVATSWTEVN